MKIIHLKLENGTEQYYAQGDIMVFDLVKFLDSIPLKADLIYTDPPWSDGNCKYWRTIAKRQDDTIKSYRLSYNHFLECLKAQIPLVSPFYIEGSRFTYNTIVNVFGSSYEHYKIFKVYYHLNKEQRLLVFSNNPLSIDYEGLCDLEYVFLSLDYPEYETVLDPCVGLGITATSSYLLNKNFIGFDLNNVRLNRTIELFEKYIVEKEVFYNG